MLSTRPQNVVSNPARNYFLARVEATRVMTRDPHGSKESHPARRLLRVLAPWSLSLLGLTLSGCDLVKGIFKAGMWVGVLGILVIVGLAAWAFSAFKRG